MKGVVGLGLVIISPEVHVGFTMLLSSVLMTGLSSWPNIRTYPPSPSTASRDPLLSSVLLELLGFAGWLTTVNGNRRKQSLRRMGTTSMAAR